MDRTYQHPTRVGDSFVFDLTYSLNSTKAPERTVAVVGILGDDGTIDTFVYPVMAIEMRLVDRFVHPAEDRDHPLQVASTEKELIALGWQYRGRTTNRDHVIEVRDRGLLRLYETFGDRPDPIIWVRTCPRGGSDYSDALENMRWWVKERAKDVRDRRKLERG
jgi:hypothetical protein